MTSTRTGAAPVDTLEPPAAGAPDGTSDRSPLAAAATAPAAKVAQEAGRVAGEASRAVGRAQEKAHAEAHPTHVALARGRSGLLVAGLGLAGFVGVFTLVRAKRSQAFDVATTMKLQARRHPALAMLMRVVSWPGFPPQSRIIPPTVVGLLWLLRFRLEAVFQLLAWGTGGLSTLVKAFMKRPRPAAGQDLRVVAAPLGGSSFPSGHVITYAGTYGWMAYMAHTLIKPAAIRRPLVALFGGLIALVGPSRIYQGHHWATDVAASYMLGVSYFIGLSSLYRRFKKRRVLE